MDSCRPGAAALGGVARGDGRDGLTVTGAQLAPPFEPREPTSATTTPGGCPGPVPLPSESAEPGAVDRGRRSAV